MIRKPKHESRLTHLYNGLGAVLVQKQKDQTWRPVAFQSRSLTACEQRYARIEKEALATTWACERFNSYLLKKTFEVQTDHKPLIYLLSSLASSHSTLQNAFDEVQLQHRPRTGQGTKLCRYPLESSKVRANDTDTT